MATIGLCSANLGDLTGCSHPAKYPENNPKFCGYHKNSEFTGKQKNERALNLAKVTQVTQKKQHMQNREVLKQHKEHLIQQVEHLKQQIELQKLQNQQNQQKNYENTREYRVGKNLYMVESSIFLQATNLLVEFVANRVADHQHEHFENKPIVLVGIGSGNAFEEIKIVHELKSKGHKISDVILIDPVYAYDKQVCSEIEASITATLLSDFQVYADLVEKRVLPKAMYYFMHNPQNYYSFSVDEKTTEATALIFFSYTKSGANDESVIALTLSDWDYIQKDRKEPNNFVMLLTKNVDEQSKRVARRIRGYMVSHGGRMNLIDLLERKFGV